MMAMVIEIKVIITTDLAFVFLSRQAKDADDLRTIHRDEVPLEHLQHRRYTALTPS